MAEATIPVQRSTKAKLQRAASRLHLSYDELIQRLLKEKEVIAPEEVAQFYESLRRDEWVPLAEVRRRLG